ncbi:MAG: matrixin family metalloprotease [Candidatus Levyibacteriota bacterium]|nr:MAG: matrixin family metalloprotease [Candidatus Levybacteria bacterium]
MKKTSFFPLFLLAIAFLYFFYPPFSAIANKVLYQSPCDTPKTYKIGIVDLRFQLPKSDFQERTKEAARIWNTALQKNLLLYDPQAILTVNLVYDQRQSLNTQINSLEGTLNSQKSSLDSEIAEYESLAKSFESKLSAFNTQVSYWNSQGGAPKDEYDKLKKEEEELKTQAQRINALAKKLNFSTQNYNTQVNTLNTTIRTFKNELQKKPEEGVYKPKEQKIDIFFDINHDELVHTLAHEFGHALDIDHIPNENAIMYPFTTQTIKPAAEEIAALQKICEKRFIGEIAFKNAVILTQELITKVKETK